MSFLRGDIVEVYFKTPGLEEGKCHPAVIISIDDVYQQDQCYVCVMLTSNLEIDTYSFLIEDKMLNKPLKNKSQARIHIIATILENDIYKKNVFATLKPAYVDKLCTKIYDNVFTE